MKVVLIDGQQLAELMIEYSLGVNRKEVYEVKQFDSDYFSEEDWCINGRAVLVAQPEQEARKGIDKLLTTAGWSVCDAGKTNIHAAQGVAIRELPLKSGHGFADYLLYVDGKAAGVIEAKKEGVTLTGVQTQAAKHIQGLPEGLPRWGNPLPFSYQSTGTETRFTLVREIETQIDANFRRSERPRQSILSRSFSGGLGKEVGSVLKVVRGSH